LKLEIVALLAIFLLRESQLKDWRETAWILSDVIKTFFKTKTLISKPRPRLKFFQDQDLAS